MNVREVLPRDAIPSIDDPTFAETYFGDPDDEVIVLEAEGEVRAYPVRILHYHEIVNDTIDDDPVAVTWCPLCGSSVVYSRRVDDRELTFGVSGKLADDDLVMYDRETESEWKQSLGEAIAGPLTGHRLEVLPSAVTTVERLREAFSAILVLQPPGGDSEAASDDDSPAPVTYEKDPYASYFEAEGFGLGARRGSAGRDSDRDDIGPKDIVLGLSVSDDAVGVPYAVAREAGGVVTLTVGGTAVVVFATSEGIHAYEDPGIDFHAIGNGRFRGDGTVWDGASGRSDDGRRLSPIPARRLFAFAWQDDHGPDSFYGL